MVKEQVYFAGWFKPNCLLLANQIHLNIKMSFCERVRVAIHLLVGLSELYNPRFVVNEKREINMLQ